MINFIIITFLVLVRQALSQTDSKLHFTEDYFQTTESGATGKEHSDNKTIILGTTVGAIAFVFVAILLLLITFGGCNTKEDPPVKFENDVELTEILCPGQVDGGSNSV